MWAPLRWRRLQRLESGLTNCIILGIYYNLELLLGDQDFRAAHIGAKDLRDTDGAVGLEVVL